MSYSMLVFEGPIPRTDEEAIQAYESIVDRYQGTATEPTPAIRAYVEALLRRWPDIVNEGGDESPWADGPIINNASGPMIHFALTFSSLDEAVPFVAAEANQRGLICVDPQGPPFVLSPKLAP